MRNLNKKQSIAVFVGLAFVAYLMFGTFIMDFFNAPQENMNANASVTNVATQELVVGQGSLVVPGDVITVHYVGTLTDGRVFDSSRDRNTPFTFTIGRGEVIRGWDEGLIGMRVGGKRVLTIKPDYAYGSQGVGSIPPNSTLIFEVDLLDAQKSN